MTRCKKLTGRGKNTMTKGDKLELVNQQQQSSLRSLTLQPSSSAAPIRSTDGRKFAERRNIASEYRWITKNIRCRRCTRFVPERCLKGGSEKVICGCGYHKSEHSATLAPLSESPVGWNQINDTQAIPTDAYGEIEFVGFGQKYAKYIRVDVETNTDTMWQLMTTVWGLTPPNLVISVTGGAKNFHMTPRLKDVFRKGLVKAALSTEAWITSSGTNAGVMKYVGEAVRDLLMGQASQSRVVALGIAPWGCVQNKHVLKQAGGTTAYRIGDERVSGETNLDCNHSHFILVDDGTQHKFAVEIPFRAKLEKTISERSSSQTADKVKVPIILVVVEGGPGTLQTVHKSIQERTPAVIIAGSGRAANILAYAIQNSFEHVFEESRQQGEKILNKYLVMSSRVEKEVKEMLSEVFNEKNEKKLNELVGWVKHCLQFPDLLSVYQLDSGHSPKDIDLVMLQALLKANHEQVMEQLKLALIWNRVDIAKSDIFTEDRQFKTGSLDDIMYSAILMNRVDFVQLFLENGICLRDFLTVERLQKLYQSAPKKTILYEQLKKARKNKSRDAITLQQVGHLIQSLMGDFYKPVYLKRPDDDAFDVDFVDSAKTGLERPARDLFIWSILMARCDMARVFWEEGRESLPAALVAHSLLKSMRQRTSDNEIKQKLHWDALKFQELAIGILRECHSDDVDRTMKLLIRPLYYWGKTNCVSIAIEANNKEFIAQSACQELFSAIWWGNLDTENGLQILPCVLCPPLALAVLRYRQEKKEVPSDSAGLAHSTVRRKDIGRIQDWPGRNESVTSQSTTDLRQITETHSVLQKIRYFFQAPVTKFCYTVAFFLIFLMLYSYVMLIDLRWRVSAAEVVLIFWVFTMAIEESRQLWKSSPGPIWQRAANYVYDKWNILDVVTIGLFTLGMILRSIPNTETFTAARVVLAINLFTFFLRLLHIFSVSKIMGPKLVMIGRMLKDLVTFMLIMLVFILGYGITSQAILYPNTDLNKMLLIDVLKKAYWQVFAELFLEEIEGKEECVSDMAAYTNGTHVRCPTEVGKVIVPILLAFYMLYMHILMLSLLIAVFTNTFEAVQSNTGLHWHFQRYKLVYEYYERPSLPPPFIIFSHIYRIVRFCMAGCETNVVYGFLSDSSESDIVDTKSLELFEENKRDEYMWQRKQGKMKTTDYRVSTTAHSVENLVSKVDDIREHISYADQIGNLSGGGTSKNGTVVKSSNRISMSDHITNLETQVREMQTSLQWLISALVDNKRVTSQPLACIQDVPSISIQAAEKETDTDADGGTMPESGKIHYYRQTTSVETRDLVTIKSRLSPYPGSCINRSEVPDKKIVWEDPFPSYNPVEYTSEEVKGIPIWADGPIDSYVQYAWNTFDENMGVNRVSYQGEYSVDDSGYPLNPIGRTGLHGRGCLGRWGPNHAADPIVTRWKHDENGCIVKRDDKPVLEFVAVRRHDNKHWALPGGFLEAGESVDEAVQRRFVEEAVAGENQAGNTAMLTLSDFLSQSTEIYRGYVDDERNTDNAWIETVALNYHDEDGCLMKDIKLRAGKTEDAVAWLPVWTKIPMQANHCFILERVAEMKGAAL